MIQSRRGTLALVLALTACQAEPTGPELKHVAPPPALALVSEQARMADSVVASMSVQTHIGYGGSVYDTKWASVIRPRLLELGVRHIRERMFSDATTIARTQDLAANGIKLTAGCWPQGTAYDDASNCITQANGYGSATIDAFDGWNEVNGQGLGSTWTDKWIRWQNAQWAAYQADPTWSSRPIFSSTTTSTAATDTLINAAPVGAKPGMTHGNMHSYPGGTGLPGNYRTAWFPKWKTISGGKPVVATETGYHSCPTCGPGVGVTQLAQGKYWSRMWFEYFNGPVFRTNAYELIDEGVSTTDREMNWGLLKNDGTPKESFTATKNIIALLADPGAAFAAGQLSYSLSTNPSSLHHTLVQKRDGRFYLALWQEVDSYNESTKKDINPAALSVTITFDHARAWKSYRPMIGPEVRTSGTGTTASVAVPDHVLIVEIGT
jgi:hypothetical protein